MSTIRWVALGVVAIILVATTLSISRWWYGRQIHEQQVRAINAEARADTLETWWLDADHELAIAGRRVLIAERDRDLADAMTAELARTLKKRDLEARAVADMYAELRDEFTAAGTMATRGDSTVVSFARRDSTFDVEGEVAIAGRVVPADAGSTARIRALARLRLLLALSCDEEGAPHAAIETFDQRVSVSDLRATVAEDVACLPDRPGLFASIVPKLTVGNTIIAVGAFVGGFLLGGR